MKVIIEKDYTAMSNKAAEITAEVIKNNPHAVLSLPTGSTPIGCLEKMADMHKTENLNFENVSIFNMDEYVALKKDDPQGYYYFLNHYLYKHVNINLENTYCPDIENPDLEKACKEYTDLIEKKGGFDLILLGIGRDGHIAFNMPGDRLQAYTHIEQLSNETIEDNSRFFENKEDTPTRAVTLGINPILASKKILLIVNGKNKGEAVKKFLENKEITTALPVSFLWLHNDVTVILDEEAAACLKPEYK